MTPHPPYLPPRISAWEPAELFYIVKHGVKFTGMPAWPAQQRDDEVWAMVAFLRTLPDLDAEDVPAARARRGHPDQRRSRRSAACWGRSRCPARSPQAADAATVWTAAAGVWARFPKLAGQRPTYLLPPSRPLRAGSATAGMMEPIAAGLSLEEMRELACYYGSLQEPSPSPPTSQASTLAIERGKAIASRGIPRQRVPACVACHGPGATRRNPIYPELAGQYADYLVLQLELFKKGHRGGSAYAHLMRPVAARLTPEQMRDVALYYASLPAALNHPAR